MDIFYNIDELHSMMDRLMDLQGIVTRNTAILVAKTISEHSDMKQKINAAELFKIDENTPSREESFFGSMFVVVDGQTIYYIIFDNNGTIIASDIIPSDLKSTTVLYSVIKSIFTFEDIENVYPIFRDYEEISKLVEYFRNDPDVIETLAKEEMTKLIFEKPES